ncbi:hypothetical protein [Fictibacillus barbaricus]|uniref:Uncharacterized protein n=1 Tax=Fictibacillus barbaricus TaxID=182136 RepID=A0ABS2ZDX5_9BACL|nr:hypothetical protein [Fictibacillus barbaricus]MBN3544826.1 hypothetical protein [Fictibacillus barbaricus]GGB63758.1 hypothetical protein GCM10007199_32270 [Fictibacillus barbaricus]
MRKTKVLPIFIGFIVLYLIINWFFPFSPISFNKEVNYNADNVIIGEYKADIKKLKNHYEPLLIKETNNKSIEDLTTYDIQYILKIHEQSWLTNKGSTAITKNTLGNMLLYVKEAREIILLLAFEETYTPNTKIYLKMLLDQTYKLEEEIKDLQLLSNLHSRSTLERQLRNLHVSYISNFQHLTSFYEEYLRSKKEA